MDSLKDLPNIGSELEKCLIQAGISTSAELINIGSESAFIRINTIDSAACFSKLMALEGAVQGIRWHNVDKTRKQELQSFFDLIKKQNE